MFEDVHLPKSLKFTDRMRNLFQFEANTNSDVVKYLIPTIAEAIAPGNDFNIPMEYDTGASFSDWIGMKKPVDTMEPRSKVVRAAYTKIANRQIKEYIDDPDPCEGYLYFGNQDFSKILPMLCQNSPFFASALTVADNDNYLELICYSDEPASDSDSKLLRILRTMIPVPARRLNVRFNKDMTINKITSYETGKAVVVDKEQWNYYASGILYNVAYFANVQHTLIHVYHYYMTAAIVFCTRHDKSLSAWADPFDDTIAIKYYEVVATLFDSCQGDNDAKGHTGKLGFGGTPAVMKELRNFLCVWGNCGNTDDFIKNHLFKDIYATAKDPENVIKTCSILPELSKHLANLEPYATELTDAMRASNPESFTKSEEILTEFLGDCGEGLSSMNSISSWIQSMGVTGMLHGSTLGYSRLVVMPEFMRWRNIKAPTFDKQDASIIQQTVGVFCGMTEGRHVFTNEIDYEGMWDTSKMNVDVKAVLDKYDGKAEDLKIKYQEELEKSADFREFGWILTDNCTDGYDGKQHTMTSYI